MISTPDGQPTEIEKFVERFALLLTEGGVPRMSARVFGTMLVKDDGKLTAGEIADRLQVSPAAVSGAVRYLQQVGLIVRRRDPGERRDHYEVTDDVWYEAFANRDAMLKQWVDLMAEGVTAVGPDTKVGWRLDTSRQFFEFLRGELTGMMQRWREYQKDPPR